MLTCDQLQGFTGRLAKRTTSLSPRLDDTDPARAANLNYRQKHQWDGSSRWAVSLEKSNL